MTDRKLYRSRHEWRIAGVCGGLAEFFRIDPTLVRVGFAVALVFGGSGGLLYLILWLVMPPAPPA